MNKESIKAALKDRKAELGISDLVKDEKEAKKEQS